MTNLLDIVTEVPPAHVLLAGEGPPVLCLHGWGASAGLFVPLSRELDDRFFLIAPDFPGFGATPVPERPWSVDDYVVWTLALLDRLGLVRVDIVAHSFGARVAIKLAAAHPERVGRMVLTGAAGVRPKRGIGYYLRVRTFKLLKRVRSAHMTLRWVRDWACRRVERSGSRDYQAAGGVMRGTFVSVVNEDLVEWLPKVTASTLLVWGDRDDETPLRDGRLMEQRIPDAGLVIFEGRSHYAYIEEAARFAHIVATFLSGEAAA